MFLSGFVQHVGQALIKYINNWRLIMFKLVLNVGDKVRNINGRSSNFKLEGTVSRLTDKDYVVLYREGNIAYYHKQSAHKYLEKVEDVTHQCTCTHSANESHVCERCARQMQKVLLQHHLYRGGIQTLAEACGKVKTTLKKERRNVITGKTQSEMIKLCGTALGVSQFNTRALGTSTGQAMVKIGEAMMHPNVPVRIVDVDHAITEHGTPRHVANKNFAAIVNHIIKKQGLLGFIVNEAHLVYCPIVTEETYVNI